MFSLEVIRAMNKEAGDHARIEGTQPYLLTTAQQLKGMPPFRFPNIGDMKIKNELITTLFCDKSGFGSSDEPALTTRQLIQTLTDLLETRGPLLIAIVEDGQFQLYLNIWKPNEEKLCV